MSFRIDSEFFTDCRKKLDGGQLRIQDQRDVCLGGDLTQQGSDQSGLPCADLSGQLNKATTLGDALHHVSQAFAVTFTHKQITRVRRYRERLFIQAKKTRIHILDALAGIFSLPISRYYLI